MATLGADDPIHATAATTTAQAVNCAMPTNAIAEARAENREFCRSVNS
jgi:hypothetical protein